MFNADGTLYNYTDGNIGIGGGVEASFDTLQECVEFIEEKQEDIDLINAGKRCKPSWWLGETIVNRYDREKKQKLATRTNMYGGVYQITTFSICNHE